MFDEWLVRASNQLNCFGIVNDDIVAESFAYFFYCLTREYIVINSSARQEKRINFLLLLCASEIFYILIMLKWIWNTCRLQYKKPIILGFSFFNIFFPFFCSSQKTITKYRVCFFFRRVTGVYSNRQRQSVK